MKVRNGFVSNSSSSSFLLFKAYMTPEQIEQVRDWDTYALTKDYFVKVQDYLKKTRPEEQIPEFFKRDPIEVKEDDFEWEPEGWRVQETNQTFDIGTDMDNYDFEFFLKVIGVDIDKMGLRTLDHYDRVLGLNDARTDIKDFVTDPHYFEHYNEEYWLTSNEYKNKVYKEFLMYSEDGNWPKPTTPKDKKVWICEDAGCALNEVEHKVRELAWNNNVFFLDKMSNGQYFDEKSKIYVEMLNAVKEVKENWRSRDDFENFTPEEEDDSQRVIAAIEGEGYFSPEEEKQYNESVDKLYKPIGKNIEELGIVKIPNLQVDEIIDFSEEVKPEDC